MEATEEWIKNYSNAAYVDLGFGDTAHYRAHTRACAEELGWNHEVLEGNPRLVIDLLEGRWNADDFLVVEPGQIITASYDNGILAAQNPDD